MSAAQKGHSETHLAAAGLKSQAMQACRALGLPTGVPGRRLGRTCDQAGAQTNECPRLPGAAIEVDFEVASSAISTIIAIIINARTRIADAAPCCCCLKPPPPSPLLPLLLLLFLLLLWTHNCQRNKFSILLEHHFHYRCNAVRRSCCQA